MTLPTHVVRQLWVQLRLLPIVASPSLAVLVAIVATDRLGLMEGRATLAIGSAMATVLGAALVAAAFADEIRSGAAAWLVVRAIPRRGLASAWLAVSSAAVVIGFLAAGVLAGLGLPPLPSRPSDPVTVAVAVAALAAPAIPLTAAALVVGAWVGSRSAMAATLVLAAALAVPLVLVGQSAIHPATGYWLAAGLLPADRPVTVGLQAIGLCLALAAVGWAVAVRVISRRDL